MPRRRDAFPGEGERCERCGTRVPTFPELAADDERAIRELVRSGDGARAMQELQRATGCSERSAKIWVVHASPRGEPPPPCPHCGERLRTAAAGQCLECGMDWHDPAAPRRRGG